MSTVYMTTTSSAPVRLSPLRAGLSLLLPVVLGGVAPRSPRRSSLGRYGAGRAPASPHLVSELAWPNSPGSKWPSP